MKTNFFVAAAIVAACLMTAFVITIQPKHSEQAAAEATAADMADAIAAARKAARDERIEMGPLPVIHIGDVDEGEEYEETENGRKILNLGTVTHTVRRM